MSLLLAWVLYALLATGMVGAFFLWAVRERQFTDQNRARYLPLSTLGQVPGAGTDERRERP